MDSEKAKELKAMGVEVVSCDSGDRASLKNAFHDTYAVFAITDFWDSSVLHEEFQHGKNIVDAAKDCGVERFVYSSLANASKLTGGKLDVLHFSLKAEVEAYARQAGLRSCAFIQAGCYMQNFRTMMRSMVQCNQDGSVTFQLPMKPDTPMYLFDVEDTGPAFVSLMKGWHSWENMSIPLCGSQITPNEMAETFRRVTGKRSNFKEIPLAEFIMKNKELGEMFEWFNDYGYYGSFDGIHCGKNNPLTPLTTWEGWLRRTGWTGMAVGPHQ